MYIENNFFVKIGDIGYKTIESAIEDATAEQTIVLVNDIEVDNTIVISKDITIDLNSKTISAISKRAIWQKEGTLTLIGKGTIKVSKTGEVTGSDGDYKDSVNFTNGSSVIRIGDNEGTNAGIIVGKDITVTSDFCYGITYFGKDTQTIIINGKVHSGYASGISGNGSKGFGSTTVTINKGAYITSDIDAGVYHPEKGILTINGGTIIGAVGVQICGGSIVINNATIVGNGNDARVSHKGDGAIIDGAAVSVINRSYPAGIPSVEIKGGDFKSVKTKSLMTYDWKNNAVSDWSAETNPVTITGGKFSNTVPSEYCEDYTPQYKFAVETKNLNVLTTHTDKQDSLKNFFESQIQELKEQLNID